MTDNKSDSDGLMSAPAALGIPDHVRTNFNTMLCAASDGNLALIQCNDAATKEVRYVICAVQKEANGKYTFVPFGHMAVDDPYSTYIPPEIDR